MTDLKGRLERLGLAQYLQAFVDEGFDSWEIIVDITESDLYVHLYGCLPGEARFQMQ